MDFGDFKAGITSWNSLFSKIPGNFDIEDVHHGSTSLAKRGLLTNLLVVCSVAALVLVLGLCQSFLAREWPDPAVIDHEHLLHKDPNASPEQCQDWCARSEKCVAFVTNEDNNCTKCIAYTIRFGGTSYSGMPALAHWARHIFQGYRALDT